MSILNVWRTPERVRVCVDTEAYDLITGLRFQMAKVYAFPHANMLIAGRGIGQFTAAFAAGIEQIASLDFDKMLDGFKEMLEAAHAGVPAYVRAALESMGCEMLLAGWSQREGRLLAHVFQRSAGVGGVFVPRNVEQGVQPWLLAPHADLGWNFGVPESDEDLLITARYQVTWHRRNAPGAPIGGSLVLAELTRDAVTVRTIGDLGTTPELPDGEKWAP